MAARRHATPARLLVLPASLGMLAAASLIVWTGPQLAAWVGTGRLVTLGFWQAQGAAMRAMLGLHPTAAYPAPLRHALPSASEFWLVEALLVVTVIALAGAAIKPLDVCASRPVSDRRWWQLRGLRPRPFARPRTIGELLVASPAPTGL
jgi:hypothetical protein